VLDDWRDVDVCVIACDDADDRSRCRSESGESRDSHNDARSQED
jgi:hypothetical protein